MSQRSNTSPLATVAALAIAATLLAGCGSSGSSPGASAAADHGRAGTVDWLVPPRPIRGLRQQLVGEGAGAAVLLWRTGAPPPPDAVVFLHGWEAMPPWIYGAWLRHLVERGNTIVYPVYQQSGERNSELLGNALAGIRIGLDRAHADPHGVVAIGHTTGGALAFDYAAAARAHRLPTPRAIFAVYPGRNPPGGELPTADLSDIPSDTDLTVVAGPGDPLPGGTAQAHAMLRDATRVSSSNRRFVSAPYERSKGPFPVSAAPRRSFWAKADRLIARARGETGESDRGAPGGSNRKPRIAGHMAGS